MAKYCAISIVATVIKNMSQLSMPAVASVIWHFAAIDFFNPILNTFSTLCSVTTVRDLTRVTANHSKTTCPLAGGCVMTCILYSSAGTGKSVKVEGKIDDRKSGRSKKNAFSSLQEI